MLLSRSCAAELLGKSLLRQFVFLGRVEFVSGARTVKAIYALRSRIFPSILSFLVLVSWLPVAAQAQSNRKNGTEPPPNIGPREAAWEAFKQHRYDDAINAAGSCIQEFKESADQTQSFLEQHRIEQPRVGKVSDDQKRAILEQGVLNDVATCYWIKARSEEQLRRKDEAREDYRATTKYSYARTWDPKRKSFWSPAQCAFDRLSTVKSLAIAKAPSDKKRKEVSDGTNSQSVEPPKIYYKDGNFILNSGIGSDRELKDATPDKTHCAMDMSDELRPKFGKKIGFPYKSHQPSSGRPCTALDFPRPFARLFYVRMLGRPYAAPLPQKASVVTSTNQSGENVANLDDLIPEIRRLLLVEIGDDCGGDEGNKTRENDPSVPKGWTPKKLCYYRYLYVNVAADPDHCRHWVKALTATNDGLRVEPDLFSYMDDKKFTLVINGTPLTEEYANFVFGSKDVSTYHVEAFEYVDGCRKYSLDYENGRSPEALDIEIPILKLNEFYDTGIRVGAPKVYDSYLLRSKLANAANQLAAITPWSATAITNAYGTIQGVTRDQSYFAAQLQTAPTPAQTLTNSIGSTSLSPTVTSTEAAQCPAGYVASPLSTTGVTCTPVVQPSCPSGYYVSSVNPLVCTILPANNPGTQIPIATTGGQLPPATFTSTQNNGAPLYNQVQTSIPSYTPTIPTAPSSNPFSAPTNVSVSSVDMLAEQVQLNAQLQMYQMLLQGSESDQFLIKNSLAVAPRAQTTIGFQVTLAPPRQYKHAVAEVRVVIVPHPTQEQVLVQSGEHISVVNLLPSQKTYNVAKITSHQNAFGAGAMIEQVNVGFSTGRSKDRLYLAKDTDTVALEYPALPTPALTPAFPERALQGLEELVKEQSLGECPNTWEDDLSALLGDSIMFGWQFRPVLGADYVTAGPREVFAQLALPNEMDQEGFAPAVYIQTRWREYDEKRQVVGPVYRDSCSWTRAQDSISILSPLRVHGVTWEDVGNGILKIRAVGKFFGSGMTVMSAGTNISPTTFDGKSIQFFAPAHDLLQNGELMLLGENGRTTPLTNTPRSEEECKIESAYMKAVPRPDGNSSVELHVEYGSGFKSEESKDGPIRPLVLVGSDVYGISTKPFREDYRYSCTGADCTYHFLASTDSLRSAQTALVRDISWNDIRSVIPIKIGPTFSSLALVSAVPASDAASTTLASQSAAAKAVADKAKAVAEDAAKKAADDRKVADQDPSDEAAQQKATISEAESRKADKAAKTAADEVGIAEKATAADKAASSAKAAADKATAVAKTAAAKATTDKAAASKVPSDKAAQQTAAASETASQKAAATAKAAANNADVAQKEAANAKAALDKVTSNKPVWYALSGTGFKYVEICQEFPDLRFYLDDDNTDGEPMTDENFRRISDTSALLRLNHVPKGKKLKIAWSPESDGFASSGLPVVWDLDVPTDSSDKAKITATPAFLYTGDSETVTFKGDFTGLNITDVEFEGTVLLKPDSGSQYIDPKKLAVPISVAITKTPGHKELVANTVDQKGKAGKTILPLDIYIFRGK